MVRVFVQELDNGAFLIKNLDSVQDAENLLKEGAWEMPSSQVQKVFGDKAGLAENATCKINKLNEESPFPFDVVFTPPVIDLEALKRAKVNEAITAYNSAIANLAKDYPTNEMLTFTQQLEQAQNITTQNNLDDVALVQGIATGRQMTQEDLALKILSKNKAFQYPCGVYLGRKQRVQDLVEQAQTEEEINAINVQAIFAEPLK